MSEGASVKTVDELWTDIGSLSGDETLHVLTRLFALYEKRLQQEPGDPVALEFFRHLDLAVDQVSQCNSNRR
jgi:hypothetical protein